MTKKHFIAFADMLNVHWRNAIKVNEMLLVTHIIEDVAHVLRKQSLNFDYDKFMARATREEQE